MGERRQADGANSRSAALDHLLDHGLILEIVKDLGYGCDLRGASGEGSTRRLRLIALGGLALSGTALQGLVYW